MHRANERINSLASHLGLGNPSEVSKTVSVLGGAIADYQARPAGPMDVHRGTSVPGTLRKTPGGVGRNVAEALSRLLLLKPKLISLVGLDKDGEFLLDSCREAGIDIRAVKVHPSISTPTVTCVFSLDGEVAAAVADVGAVEAEMTPAFLNTPIVRDALKATSLLVLDGNMSVETLAAAVALRHTYGYSVFFEPVSVPKSLRIAGLLQHVDYLKPNREELASIANAVRAARGGSTSSSGSSSTKFLTPPAWPLTWRSALKNLVTDALADLAVLLHEGCRGIYLSVGAQGAIFARRASPHTATMTKTEHGVHMTLLHVGPLPVKIASLVGAGDCFVAGCVSALAADKGEVEALLHGVGSATVSIQSLENVPRELSQGAIRPYIEQARRLLTSAEFRVAV